MSMIKIGLPFLYISMKKKSEGLLQYSNFLHTGCKRWIWKMFEFKIWKESISRITTSEQLIYNITQPFILQDQLIPFWLCNYCIKIWKKKERRKLPSKLAYLKTVSSFLSAASTALNSPELKINNINILLKTTDLWLPGL